MYLIKRLIYSLKHKYGQPIDFYREIESTPDILTGKIIKSRIKYCVKKAIVLKEKMDTSSTFIPKANPIIGISGLIEINDTELLIDGNDFSKDFIPLLSDYIISNEERYDIDFIKYIDSSQVYHIGLKDFKGSQLYKTYNLHLHDKLTFIHLIKQHVQ